MKYPASEHLARKYVSHRGMKNILIIGSTGQIGSELVRELRSIYGGNNVVAGFIKGAEPTGELLEGGPSAECDVTNPEMIAAVVKKYNIDTIYNLAALLSVVADFVRPLFKYSFLTYGMIGK